MLLFSAQVTVVLIDYLIYYDNIKYVRNSNRYLILIPFVSGKMGLDSYSSYIHGSTT